MFRAIAPTIATTWVLAAAGTSVLTVSESSAPPESAPSATLSVSTGAPGSEVEATWLDEWRDAEERTVTVRSDAFEKPALLTFTGRQYTGVARLRADAEPGEARAQVISHGGKSVKKANFRVGEAGNSGSGAFPWVVGGVGGAVVLAAGAGFLVRARRRKGAGAGGN
ncbi:hypothetical protein ABT160_30685 [Streptomyces sp. NPDC001941]|uniref:hypothetical protein n=1 Tax=Streptomyces sp. NPDC001941 TaxID=3154659 RepID=UPI0033194E40